MKSSSKIILGILGAAAVGVAVGMLLAPEKGSELRNKVKNTANDFAGTISDLFAETKNELSGLTKKAKAKAGEMASGYTNSVKG